MEASTLSIAALALGAACILLACLKSRHFLKYIILSILSGLAALFAVQLLGSFTQIEIPVTPLTIGISCIGGVPGVILLLITDLLSRL